MEIRKACGQAVGGGNNCCHVLPVARILGI